MKPAPQHAAAAHWIKTLKLRPHPEGGWFRETYRSSLCLPRRALGKTWKGPRSASTAILFLLEAKTFSTFHRIASDELWHFHAGAPVALHILHPSGHYQRLLLGTNPSCLPQICIPGGCWFAAEPVAKAGFSLVGCTVAPGFDFADFEIASRHALCRQFPRKATLIRRLTPTRLVST